MDWPHAPLHRPTEGGVYIVTASTYGKQMLFSSEEKRSMLHDALLNVSAELGWRLQAWAVMANHYHFVAASPDGAATLSRLIRRLHGVTARELNVLDEVEGRKVWFQYWDTLLTYERSYLARLNYVHENPVRRGLVQNAEDYRWCSAKWFSAVADSSFRKTVYSFKIDEVRIPDEF